MLNAEWWRPTDGQAVAGLRIRAGPVRSVQETRSGRHSIDTACRREGVRSGGDFVGQALGQGPSPPGGRTTVARCFNTWDDGPSPNPIGPEGRRPGEHFRLVHPWWFPVRPPGGRWLLGCPVPGNEFPGYQRAPSGRSARPGSDAARRLAGVGCHGQAQPWGPWPSSTLGAMAKHDLGCSYPRSTRWGAMAKLNGVERRHGNTVRLHRLLTPGPVDRRSGPFARAPTTGNKGSKQGRGGSKQGRS